MTSLSSWIITFISSIFFFIFLTRTRDLNAVDLPFFDFGIYFVFDFVKSSTGHEFGLNLNEASSQVYTSSAENDVFFRFVN